MSTQTNQSPLYCDLTALTDAERQEHVAVSEALFASLEEVKELSDGYAFRFPATDDMLHAVAGFVAGERKCCPFYDFTLKVEREGGPLWLQLTGRQGVKEFIEAEMAPHEELARFFS